MNLHKDLASSGWHSSIVTTYSVDPAFYDMYVERRLRMHGVKNSILMADARMLKKALDALPEAFTRAGSQYAVVPVRVVGAFHPKVHLRLGESKACLVIGSANATAAGWGKNQEVVTRLNWNWRTDDEGDNRAMGSLVAKAYAYLAQWLREVPGEAIRYKLQMIERQAPWLADLHPSSAPIVLLDGSAVDLFCESSGNSSSILKQFSEMASQEKVQRLVVVSPYWDSDLRGFHDLREALGNPPTIVALNPRTNTFPLEALAKKDALQFIDIDDTSKKFLHAKLFIAQTKKVDHVLFGSANCSDDALGHLRGKARNAEVSVYRRIPPGFALNSLDMDLSKVVPRTALSLPIHIPTSPSAKESSVPAGVIELMGQTLSWWPPINLDARGAIIELNGVLLTPRETAAGKWSIEFTSQPTSLLIAKVRYQNGQLSDPVIVHCEAPLRKAAPGRIDPRLKDALDKARGPDGDLLELAAQAHIIFEPAPRRVTAKHPGGTTTKPKPKNRAVVDYGSEAEFRNAMKMKPGTGRTGRTDEDDPGFQDLLSIIGGDIAGSLPKADSYDDEQDEALLDGDAEDDADDRQVNEPDDHGRKIPPPNKKTPPYAITNDATFFTVADVLLRRKQLAKALDLFDALLEILKKDPSLISSRLASQTIFVFRLMRYGLAHVHKISDGRSQKLMVMAERGLGPDRSYSFVYRAALMLRQIWAGNDPIFSHIKLKSSQAELPDDIYRFIAVSRWALARAYLESKSDDAKSENSEPSRMTLSLSRIGREIYAATVAMGPVDAEAEEKTILEMDAEIGCTPAQTKELMQCLGDFRT